MPFCIILFSVDISFQHEQILCFVRTHKLRIGGIVADSGLTVKIHEPEQEIGIFASVFAAHMTAVFDKPCGIGEQAAVASITPSGDIFDGRPVCSPLPRSCEVRNRSLTFWPSPAFRHRSPFREHRWGRRVCNAIPQYLRRLRPLQQRITPDHYLIKLRRQCYEVSI